MRLKSELYKKEQEEIVNKIITILDLENKTEYTLYELDKNEEIQKRIMTLIPEIRKYYSFNGIKAVGEPNKIKRKTKLFVKKQKQLRVFRRIPKTKIYTLWEGQTFLIFYFTERCGFKSSRV